MDLFACRQMGGVEAIGSDPRDEINAKTKWLFLTTEWLHYSSCQLEDSGYSRFTLVVQTNCMRLMQ